MDKYYFGKVKLKLIPPSENNEFYKAEIIPVNKNVQEIKSTSKKQKKSHSNLAPPSTSSPNTHEVKIMKTSKWIPITDILKKTHLQHK